jgi:type I restriction enzyme S subunit
MSSWEKVKLGDTATFINGYPFKPEEWSQSGKKIIRIQNLTKSTSTDANRFQGKIPEKYLVKKGDLLISWSATIGVFEWHEDDAWLNQHIFKVVFDKRKIDKTYFKFLIGAKLNELERQVHGATMKHITKGKFDNIEVPLPPLDIQELIANTLEKADALRQKDQELLQKYDELANAIFYDMFGDPVRNEKGWEIHKFGQVGTLDRGVSKHRPRNAPELLGGKYPLIQTGDVANSKGYITTFKQTYSELGFKQSKLWPKGTLCITIAANIAKTGILEFDACFPDSVVGFTPSPHVSINYVRYWLKSIQKILEETAPESAQKNINLEILRNLTIPVAPRAIQDSFENSLKNIKGQISLVERQAALSDNIFLSLLTDSFN